MTADAFRTMTTAAELRRLFDQSFAEPARADATRQDDLLALRVEADPFAVRLSEVAGLLVDRSVTSVPGAVREMLGVAGLRGTILPVYDLRALLGYSRSGVPRWLLITAAPQIGLAFDEFDGLLRVPPEAIAAGPSVDARTPHVREVVQTERARRPVIHLASVLDAIGTLARQPT